MDTNSQKKIIFPDLSLNDLAKGKITRLGTIAAHLVESTPIVWKGRLYLFLYMRGNTSKAELGSTSYFCFFDWETGEHSTPFGEGFDLGSAFVDNDRLYVFGVQGWGTGKIYCFTSDDMITFTCFEALSLPGWTVFNTSATKNNEGVYTLTFEVSQAPGLCNESYRCYFAQSNDMYNWQLLDPKTHNYKKGKFSACPWLEYLSDGYYYMTYLDVRHDVSVSRYYGPGYYTQIARTKNFSEWEECKAGCFMDFGDPGDAKDASGSLTPEEQEMLKKTVNINTSDVDMVEYSGKTLIMYAWGDQLGSDHLSAAVYPGPVAELCSSFFQIP